MFAFFNPLGVVALAHPDVRLEPELYALCMIPNSKVRPTFRSAAAAPQGPWEGAASPRAGGGGSCSQSRSKLLIYITQNQAPKTLDVELGRSRR